MEEKLGGEGVEMVGRDSPVEAPPTERDPRKGRKLEGSWAKGRILLRWYFFFFFEYLNVLESPLCHPTAKR